MTGTEAILPIALLALSMTVAFLVGGRREESDDVDTGLAALFDAQDFDVDPVEACRMRMWCRRQLLEEGFNWIEDQRRLREEGTGWIEDLQ